MSPSVRRSLPVRETVLRIADDLAFRLAGFPPDLDAAIRARFGRFVASAGTSGVDALQVEVESGDALPASPTLPILVDRPPMRIRGNSEGLVFELPGIRCRCAEYEERAVVCIEDGRAGPMTHLIPWLLVAVLFHLARSRGWLGLHAAAVEIGGRAILLPGPSGCGKSTLHRQAREHGLGVLSEDLVWACPRPGGHRIRAFPRQGEEPPTVDDLPLGHIVVPSIRAGGPSRLRALPQASAARELMEQAGLLPSGPRAREHFVALVSLSRSVACHALEAGPSGDAIQLLVDTLTRSAGA